MVLVVMVAVADGVGAGVGVGDVVLLSLVVPSSVYDLAALGKNMS